jgi:hypothetical protein
MARASASGMFVRRPRRCAASFMATIRCALLIAWMTTSGASGANASGADASGLDSPGAGEPLRMRRSVESRRSHRAR